MDVDLYADPSCPWSWATYLWIDQVAPRRQLKLRMRPFSLLLRDGTAHLPPPLRAAREQAHRALRVAAAITCDDARSAFYAGITEPVYAAMASGRPPRFDIAEALARTNLDPEFAVRADDTALDAVIERSMESLSAFLRVTEESTQRIPVIVLHTERGTFASHGPLLDPAPRGRDAVRLWDATEQLLQFPGVHGISMRPQLPHHSLVAGALG